MVSAPASRPCLDSSLRSRTICVLDPGGTACGLVCGRLERGSKAASPSALVALDQLLHPVAGDVVVAGDLALGAALDDDSGDDQPGLGHGRHLRTRCQLCPGTGANYVVEPDTVSPTRKTASDLRKRRSEAVLVLTWIPEWSFTSRKRFRGLRIRARVVALSEPLEELGEVG